MSIRLITFDAFFTLFQPKYSVGQLYLTAAKHQSITAQQLQESFAVSYTQFNSNFPNFGKISSRYPTAKLWWKDLVAMTFRRSGFTNEQLQSKPFNALFEQLYTDFAGQDHYTIYPEVIPTLEKLKSKFQLGVISNADDRLEVLLRSLDLHKYFDFAICSYDIGVEKPDIRVFQEAIRQSQNLSIQPKQCLHIGDDSIRDYHGALSAGWNAILLNRSDNRGIEQVIQYLSIYLFIQ